MIEYLLIVIVTVIIIVGLAQKMYKPLGDFVEGLMGGYVACLLETGELPQLGASNGPTSTCRPPLMGAEPMDLYGNPKDSSKKPNSSADRDRKNEGDSGEDSDGSSGGSRSNSAASRMSSRGPRSVGRGGSPGMDGSSGGGKKIEIALDGGGAGSFFRSQNGMSSGSMYRQSSKYIAITGGLAEEVKKRQEREAAKNNVQKVDGMQSVAKKKLAIKPPEKKDRGPADDNMGTLDISQIIKYILIAGIVIILLVLIGGQALQLSKSWEKGE